MVSTFCLFFPYYQSVAKVATFSCDSSHGPHSGGMRTSTSNQKGIEREEKLILLRTDHSPGDSAGFHITRLPAPLSPLSSEDTESHIPKKMANSRRSRKARSREPLPADAHAEKPVSKNSCYYQQTLWSARKHFLLGHAHRKDLKRTCPLIF